MKASTIFAVALTAVLSYASPVPEEQSTQGGYPGGPPPGFPALAPQGYGGPGIGAPIVDPIGSRPPFGGPGGQPWGPPPAAPWGGPGPQPWGPPGGQCPGTCGPHPGPPAWYPPPPPPPCPTCGPFFPGPPPPPPGGNGCGNGGQVSCCNSDDSGGFLNILGGSCQLSLFDGACASHCCQTTQNNDGFSVINIGQICDVL